MILNFEIINRKFLEYDSSLNSSTCTQNIKDKIETLCIHVNTMWESLNIFSCINRINFTKQMYKFNLQGFLFTTQAYLMQYSLGSVFVYSYEKSILDLFEGNLEFKEVFMISYFEINTRYTFSINILK